MTRDEARAKCIEAMKVCAQILTIAQRAYDDEQWTNIMAAAFDSLATVPVRVVPIEATEEMTEASYEKERNLFGPTACGLTHSLIFETMCAAGDLTNAPEKK